MALGHAETGIPGLRFSGWRGTILLESGAYRTDAHTHITLVSNALIGVRNHEGEGLTTNR